MSIIIMMNIKEVIKKYVKIFYHLKEIHTVFQIKTPFVKKEISHVRKPMIDMIASFMTNQPITIKNEFGLVVVHLQVHAKKN